MFPLLFIIVSSLLVGLIHCETLTVALGIGDSKYSVSLDPKVESAEDAARKFCRNNMSIFLLTEATFASHCVSPVAIVVQQAVDKNEEDIPLDQAQFIQDDPDDDL